MPRKKLIKKQERINIILEEKDKLKIEKIAASQGKTITDLIRDWIKNL